MTIEKSSRKIVVIRNNAIQTISSLNSIIGKVKKHQFILLLGSLVGLLILAAQVLGALNTIQNQIKELATNKSDSQIINELRAGATREYFSSLLGAPINAINVGTFIRELYRFKDNWITTIANSNGTVDIFTVTACTEDITIEQPLRGQYLVLNETTLDQFNISVNTAFTGEVVKHSTLSDARYFISSATANSYIYESIYLGNPGGYQTVIYGISDACLFDALLPGVDYEANYFEEMLQNISESGSVDIRNPAVHRFRQESVINTWGMTSPFFDFTTDSENVSDWSKDILLKEIPKGLFPFSDRITTRTLF